MPAFSAINVEPEENVEDEVAVTRRIQIDGALKLYQAALKLHAQGPRSLSEADKAYKALFQSAVFSYPEAKTEYERVERQSDSLLTPNPSFPAGLDAALLDDSSSGSSLLQAYYISYKNHGQFLLDRIRHRVRTANKLRKTNSSEDDGSTSNIFEDETVVDDARASLDEFGAALDRDPSDAELWRRTARVAAFLKSARVERYCLEAAIELDDDPAVIEVPPPSLAEGFAGEQLRNQLQALSDDIALSHPSMAPFLKRQMATALKRFLDPLPWLPNIAKNIAVSRTIAPPPTGESKARHAVSFTSPSWAELGTALAESVSDFGLSGEAVQLDAPPMPDENQIIQIELDQQLSTIQGSILVSADDSVMEDPKEKMEDDGDEGSDSAKKAMSNGTAMPGDKDTDAASIAHTAEKEKERSASQHRKRTQSAAGLPDTPEEDNGDTKRSKRIRRRETLAEGAVDPIAVFAPQLERFQEGDTALFTLTRRLLERLGVPAIPALDETVEACGQTADRIEKLRNQPARDMRLAFITAYKDDRAKILLSKKDAPVLGIDAFLEHSKTGQQHSPETAALDEMQGLRAFVLKINNGWYTSEEAAFAWLAAMRQSYTTRKWSEAMKNAVLQVLQKFDEPIYRRICCAVTPVQKRGHEDMVALPSDDQITRDLVQMVFELYLVVHERVSNSSSAADVPARIEARCRLDRWMSLASALAHRDGGQDDSDLSFRFLWACVANMTTAPGVARDHALACWESLRRSLRDEEQNGRNIEILMPNNSAMPEVSFKAADREISKLTTMDFFLTLFQEELKDPVLVIDKLEPVLNPSVVYVQASSPSSDSGSDAAPAALQRPIAECAGPELRDMWKFLHGSNTDLRLFLWSRLAGAYAEIDYTTKVLSCHLRSIEMIADDLESEAYLSTPQEATRLKMFLRLLKTLDETIIQALHLAVNDTSAFDIIDIDHIRTSASALVRISCMLHVATLHDDEVRVGMTSAASTTQTFHNFQSKLREMQVRTWSLQYAVVKMGLKMMTATSTTNGVLSASGASTPALAAAAAKPLSPPASETESQLASGASANDTTASKISEQRQLVQSDMAEYLGCIHEVIGSRKFCKASSKIFLRLARSELLKMRKLDNWEVYLGQVLYDLHGLKLGVVAAADVEEHGCPTERLERKNALALVDKVMALASRMSMKDLLKSDLKNTIEHMQQAIGQTKSTTQMIHNLRYFTEYLKRPIHPLRLYQAWKGTTDLDTVPATTPDTVLARNGWFFLMGMVALTKFKGVDLNRRQTPGATDDLRVGAQYLRLQLQLTPARWDAWFRLAECFDYDLDETVLWSAEKMNKDRGELVKLQRSAIHCYTLSLSYWHADAGELVESDLDVLHDLHHNFGMRLFASSREPFAMEAFHRGETERWFIAPDTLSPYTRPQYGEMTDYMVWKYAAGLFRRALARRAKDWKSAYMLSKCVWKMYQKPLAALHPREQASHPTVDDVVRALEKSVEVVSLLPKPRHGDPILEPHYKIVSVVAKLVQRGDMHAQAAADLLQRMPYAADRGATVSVTSAVEWKAFLVQTLQHLRDKDKSNWQHRMTVRHAKLLFDDCDLNDEKVPSVAVSGDATKETATPKPNGTVVDSAANGTSTNGVGSSEKDNKDSNDAKEGVPDKTVGSTNTAAVENAEQKSQEKEAKEAGINSKQSDAANGLTTASPVSHGPDNQGGPAAEDKKMDVDSTAATAVEDGEGEADANKTSTSGGASATEEGGPAKGTTATQPHDNRADAATRERQEKAQAAFAVLRESMFTKTMVMNVWKCDAERPGRHHVFTEQYVRFVTRLLVVLDDHVNLEALLRRIRKKAADFYHFTDLWQTCVLSYTRLVRQHYAIPHGADEVLKSVTAEEMDIYAERIADWVGRTDGGGDGGDGGDGGASGGADHLGFAALSAMREAVEMKKLNGNLMKAGPIDDLISDCYGILFANVGRSLPGEDPAKVIEARHRRQREEVAKAEKEQASKDKQAEAAAMMHTFSLLSDRSGGGGGGGGSGLDQASRAGSEVPGASALHILAGSDKAERAGTGDVPLKRPRLIGVRRPDILRRAEQAVSRLGEPSGAAKVGAASGGANSNSNGSGSGGGNGQMAGIHAGTGGGASGRRSTRIGSSSGGSKNDARAAVGLDEPSGSGGGGAGGTSGKDGSGSGGDGDNDGDGDGEGEGDEDGAMARRRRSTRSKSRHRSVDHHHPHHHRDRRDGDGDDVDMKDVPGDDDGAVTAAASEASSPAGSVHDSADDESELSDVPADYEENVPEALLFPNLQRSQEAEAAGDAAGKGAGAGASVQEQEEEEDDDDDEEDDDGDDEDAEDDEEDGHDHGDGRGRPVEDNAVVLVDVGSEEPEDVDMDGAAEGTALTGAGAGEKAG